MLSNLTHACCLVYYFVYYNGLSSLVRMCVIFNAFRCDVSVGIES